MRITIIAVGKIKEKFYRDAVEEYIKRLGRYYKTDVIELQDEKAPEHISAGQAELIKKTEADRILAKIQKDAFVCTLEIGGKKMDSAELASFMESLALHGKDRIQFIIGGSLGLHDSVSRRADLKLSFSDFTFPHQLMRVILAEQIYRSCKIIYKEPYHK